MIILLTLLFIVYCLLFNFQFLMSSGQYAVGIVYCALCSIYFEVCIVKCALGSVLCEVFSVQC